MSFASYVKNRQIWVIAQLLTIFGVVEVRQMRELFSYMSDEAYGKILARMQREGSVYHSPDAQHLATSRFSLERFNLENSVMCFWAFIRLKNKVLDFCGGEAPALVAVSTKHNEFTLIPVDGKNAALINQNAEELPENTDRFLITKDLKYLEDIVPRYKNDYALLVGQVGVIGAYEL